MGIILHLSHPATQLFRRKHEHFLTTRLSCGLPMPEPPRCMMSSCDSLQVLHSGRPPAASCLALQRKVKRDLYCTSFHDYPPSFLILLCTLGSDQNGWRQQITFVLQLLVCMYQQSTQRWGRLGLWFLFHGCPLSLPDPQGLIVLFYCR